MRLVCLFMFMLGLTFALLTSHVYADSVKDDIALFQQQTGVCPGGIAVFWVHHYVVDGKRADAGASAGVCEIWFDTNVRSWSICDTRRLVFHEGGHILGLDDGGDGIMSTFETVRDRAAVPGCPVHRLTAVQRAEQKLLDTIPAGWSGSCGHVGRKVRCTAEGPGKRPHVRRYEVHATATKIALHRVKNQ